ncbi:hypothetical protein XYCOK13_28040 [Xylanibacillus composti]|uniref:Uncharacterized protein n=1 Tax=Xylanibacillus composti TaxID=1572762 RepID=A0A8J4M3D1_9BACL|nr:hypothetical protein [Xylanibacillus composti]GIQ69980.1 hypothetical protein XYCOK13_28040 [Xylanibacillus composti]
MTMDTHQVILSTERRIEQMAGDSRSNKAIYLFGGSSGARIFLEDYPAINVKRIVDNDPKKWGTTLEGIEICEPEILNHEVPDDVLIFITSMYVEQISQQLEQMGFVRNQHFTYALSIPMTSLTCYIDPEVGPERFFQHMAEAEIDYVILRWYEQLPDWNSKDIDILVRDSDYMKLYGIHGFTLTPGGIPCEVYCVNGFKESNLCPYYPPYLAQSILERKMLWRGKYYVPDDHAYFFSLAYHVVYHKAEKSGLPIYADCENPKLQHDNKYARKLLELATSLKYEVPLNLESLHQFLQKHNWAPSIDTVRRLAIDKRSPWLESLHPSTNKQAGEGEFMVFIVREWAVANNLLQEIEGWLSRNGLEIMHTQVLDQVEKVNAAQRIRSGNWGTDAWGESGGEPAAVIAVFDRDPTPVTDELLQVNPYVRNMKYYMKRILREDICKKYLGSKKVNFIHSSDDEAEAWEYVRAISPQLVERIEKWLREKV